MFVHASFSRKGMLECWCSLNLRGFEYLTRQCQLVIEGFKGFAQEEESSRLEAVRSRTEELDLTAFPAVASGRFLL